MSLGRRYLSSRGGLFQRWAVNSPRGEWEIKMAGWRGASATGVACVIDGLLVRDRVVAMPQRIRRHPRRGGSGNRCIFFGSALTGRSLPGLGPPGEVARVVLARMPNYPRSFLWPALRLLEWRRRPAVAAAQRSGAAPCRGIPTLAPGRRRWHLKATPASQEPPCDGSPRAAVRKPVCIVWLS
jgi:hypothetical protein